MRFSSRGHDGVESAGSDDIAFAKIITQTVTPGSVGAANASATEQDVTVVGVKVGDIVIINHAATGNATTVGAARVKATDTVSIQYNNPTAGALTPGAGTYTFFLLRKATRA